MKVVGYVCIGQKEFEVFTTICHSGEVDNICEEAKITCYNSRIHKQHTGKAWIVVEVIDDDGTVKRI